MCTDKTSDANYKNKKLLLLTFEESFLLDGFFICGGSDTSVLWDRTVLLCGTVFCITD